MKYSLWIFILLLGFMALAPLPANAAISKQNHAEVFTKKQTAHQQVKTTKQHFFKKKFGKVRMKFKQKIQRWKAAVQMAFPSGKLLSSLIFLVLSIIFFAVGGVTEIAYVFSILGSVSIILALILFVLWITERAKSTSQPTN